MFRIFPALMTFAILAIGVQRTNAAPKDVPHPFILWTKDDIAAMRQRLETPWAKDELARMEPDKNGLGKTYRNLFKYAVLGDRKAGEVERDYLLHVIGTHPKQFDGPEKPGRHYDCYLDALRYDLLQDLLTPEQKAMIEETFRAYVDHQLEDTAVYTRVSWLPNMQWPRPMAAHLMAVALRDEKRIRALADGRGGWRNYFDEYLADGYFYFEEFGKQYSMTGQMLLFCRGLERLGMNDVGYGYVGKGGATMRKYVESIPRVGYPRTDLPGGLPRYSRVTMGDAKGGLRDGPRFVFDQAFVQGHLANGAGGNLRWSNSHMNGKDHKGTRVDKMLEPLVFEIAHAKWPDAHFDYFLAQMRSPGQDRYVPTLFFGLDPIDPAKTTPPAAPSYVADERGFALLRAQESPKYWESESPAVALQFAMLYVHYLPDCFSLLGYHAFNRPIYYNRAISHGYAGGPYDFSVRSHCGVVVDNLQAQPTGPVPSRFDFAPAAKFVSVRTPKLEKPYYTGKEVRSSDQPKEPATEVYPGVALCRSLVLTNEYLFDVYRLTSDRPHAYHWLVHALGEARPDNPEKWVVSDELRKTLFDVPDFEIGEAKRFHADAADWSLTTLQTCQFPDAAQSKLGKAWYDRKIGVRVSMLGDPGTTAFSYVPPTRYAPGSPRTPPAKLAVPEVDEAGGVSIAVARKAANTTFVALHEPFKGGQHRITDFQRIAQDDRAVAVRVRGKGIDDRVMIRFDDSPKQPVTLAGGGESFSFSNYAFIRIGADAVDVSGDLTAMKLRVAGQPKLIVRGKNVAADVSDGFLTFGK